MDNWTKEFLAFCNTLNQDIEEFWKEVEQFTEQFSESLDEMVQQTEETIAEEIDVFWQEFFEPLIEFDEMAEFGDEDFDFVIASKVYPTQNTHPACQGCRHYHGYVYGGNLFVCAMHPYGWPDENCPDWEGKGSGEEPN
ncbi:MAG: hypothetical protein BRC33_08415 [Cyanobacteria bacterium SW_9_44_58]|nr:MAG: hypothetical protein BRC33_08415 [Cyanobacteria bacterium SW_9_44_58]